jgi:HK97 family phage portal protein
MKWLRKKDVGASYFTWSPSSGGGGIPQDKAWLMNQGYRMNSIASACIQMVASSLPESQLNIYRKNRDGELEVLPEHWLADLIRYPNDATSTFELWEKTAIYLLTAGSAYWLLMRDSGTGPIERIELLRPDLVTPEVDQATGRIVAWKYRPEGTGQEIVYPVYQVLAIAFPDPLGVDGLSPLSRVMREIGIDNGATDFTREFFENGAVVAGILSSEQELDKDTADRIEERWNQKFSRWARGRFKTAVLGKGTTYQQMALNFRDMEFESVRSFVETRICSAFGVDPVLLPSWVGIRHGGKYSNYQEARRHLWLETIVPLLRRIESKINSQLLVYEDDVFCRFDLGKVEALQENENDKWERVREAFRSDLITLGHAQRLLDVPVDEENEEKYFSEMRGQNLYVQRPGLGISEDEGQEKTFYPHIKKKSVDKNKFTEFVKGVQDEYAKDVQGAMVDFFERFKGKVVDRLKKKELTPEEYFAVLLALQQSAQESEEELQSVSLETFLTVALGAGSLIAGELGLAFDPDDETLRAKLREYSLLFASQVMSSTRRELFGILEKAQRKRLTYTELEKELLDHFDNLSQNKAALIARTETVKMVNLGSATSYVQNGYTHLEWHAIHDKKTCPFCAAIDGKVTPSGMPFVAKGDTITGQDENGETVTMNVKYENVLIPPLHPRCRCAILPA